MAVTNVTIRMSGERCGDLISLGGHYLFYTTHRDLLLLDGARFDTPAEARGVIGRALAERNRAPGRGIAAVPTDRLSA
ncbi:MAG: hypothetical protein RID91_19210 [Azospirillaceae bacterium]